MTERYELPEELRLTKNLVRDFNRNEIIPLEQQIPHDSITIPEDDYLRLSKKTVFLIKSKMMIIKIKMFRTL